MAGIWLNTYAQLNIPSPIFYNVENVMNDLRMMYFGKQSEDEIINSKPHKVTFIHLLFDESILQNINDNFGLPDYISPI